MSSKSVASGRDLLAGLPPCSGAGRVQAVASVPSFSCSSVYVDIKAFKGKGAFRSLSRQLADSVAQIRDAMNSLALDTTRFEVRCYLRMVEERGRGALGRTRLRWCIRGQARYVRFEALTGILEALPLSVVEHFRNCDVRALELNALESVMRQAVDQVESYLRNGALRQRAEIVRGGTVLQQNR
ncbi:MAG: hypothetical protein IJF82_12220 [Achromobacter sp.]|uniref:hypothetical protein n=1 Tax=Alcaligenes xylosoxydans xylosoxydans TaxID=85698 RepID=UPI001908DFA5|nr:hypothetical protein [Achromobacter xylosoxidans]MBK1982728.1 hypothetical protein [Achromobacter xylosoxidans]MBQ2648126.1 hypothetical protein [Achromobacter sp.]